MKTIIKSTLSIVLALLLVLCVVACDDSSEQAPAPTPDANTTETTDTTPTTPDPNTGNEDGGNTVTKTGVWTNAKHLKNMTFGEGAKTLSVVVKAENQSVTFTIKTDKTTVGAALMEHDLLEGEDSQFGLYIKKVNGMLADYDVDKSYWAFYVDGAYSNSGVDTTDIVEGATYSLEYTK
ncbi:MAG: DUF4430 domain-containing protein [Ruminococcaceae bacterium]|nr:DUF4430 domain-containing protein [Oscillospiraceae bacterium]